MLAAIGVASMDDLLVDIPSSLRIPNLQLPAGLSEFETMAQIKALAARNRVFADICRIRNVIYDLQTVILDFSNDLSHFIDGGPETIRCIFEKQSDAGLLSKWQQGA